VEETVMVDSSEDIFTSMALVLGNPVRMEDATKLVSRDGKTKDLSMRADDAAAGFVSLTERNWSSRVASPVSETARTVDGIQGGAKRCETACVN
jgi:hypothetical protein